MIAALAGRRIDAPDKRTPRFPADRIPYVERAIREHLRDEGVTLLVCAAACGSDLLALSAASQLGVRRRIVLPFAVDVFRKQSVVDRPGDYPWGELYDRFIKDAQSTGGLVLLGFAPGDPAAYEETNCAILDCALSAAAQERDRAEAFTVWNADNPTAHDYTAHFAKAARERRMPVKSIGILES